MDAASCVYLKGLISLNTIEKENIEWKVFCHRSEGKVFCFRANLCTIQCVSLIDKYRLFIVIYFDLVLRFIKPMKLHP